MANISGHKKENIFNAARRQVLKSCLYLKHISTGLKKKGIGEWKEGLNIQVAGGLS